MNDVELLAAYEPIVRFNMGELFFPAAVEDYVACCDLMERVAGQSPNVVVPRGELTPDRLGRSGRRTLERACTCGWSTNRSRERRRRCGAIDRIGRGFVMPAGWPALVC